MCLIVHNMAFKAAYSVKLIGEEAVSQMESAILT
jgi:hypothetical protein